MFLHIRIEEPDVADILYEYNPDHISPSLVAELGRVMEVHGCRWKLVRADLEPFEADRVVEEADRSSLLEVYPRENRLRRRVLSNSPGLVRFLKCEKCHDWVSNPRFGIRHPPTFSCKHNSKVDLCWIEGCFAEVDQKNALGSRGRTIDEYMDLQ